ncbi:FAD-dependent oxidoreductase, partial [bacterium]|nr:FAD-dependent oxidoreductase [bacterium]
QLWVRCRDWDKTSPGAFQVLINGRASPTIFGTQEKPWAWVSGSAFDLPKGQVEVRLHDTTGYYGRCDAVLLTTDPAFRPPDDVKALAKLRGTLLGMPKPQSLDYDLVVVGAGYGGVCCAVQAARLGVKTALIQNRPCLGGNASKEINVGPGGACPHSSIFRETGVCEEIAEGRYHGDSQNWSDAMDLVVKDCPNLTVYLDTEGIRAVMDGPRRIAAVEAEHVVSGQRYVFRAPLFADCTGDGAIAVTTGAEFRWGQEARAVYGESIAPELPTRHTMGTSIIHGSRRMDTPQPYTPPPFAVKFKAEHFLRRKRDLTQGTWWIEYGGLRNTIEDAEEIRDELIRVVFGAFDWAKNHDPATIEKAKYHALTRVPTVGGKRESRRFMGDYVLRQQDLQAARMFPDRVAFGGWPIDLHPSPGIYGKDVPPAIFNRIEKPYSIPYRILYTRDVENVFLAGRHASVSHVALGSTRLMQTIGAMGQAAGAAAYLCRKHDTNPRGVNPKHIAELQQLLLKWDAYIPGMKNEDAKDFCRGARATASSSAPPGAWGRLGSQPKPDREAPCTMDRGQIVVFTKSVPTLHLYLKATEAKPVMATLRVEQGALDEGALKPLFSVAAEVKLQQFRWVAIKLPQPLKAGVSYFILLPRQKGLCWNICKGGGGHRVYGSPDKWTRVGGRYSMRPFAAVMPLGDAGPAAAVDGLKWPLGGQSHQWRSDPDKALPQWIEVDFGKPVALNTVYLTFDSHIYGRSPVRDAGAHVTAQNYRILVQADGAWKIATEARGNWRRFRRHGFLKVTTTKLRLEVTRSRGDDEARLYEIRAYDE